jgi:hypothetical protein
MPKLPRVPRVPVAAAAPTVSVATRLKPFGLSAAKLQLSNDLEVPVNQTVVLSASDKKLAAQVTRLTPKTIGDLKTWIGVPDSVFAHPAVPAPPPMAVLPVHTAYTPDQSKTLHVVARNYIFGNSGAVSPAQVPALNAWLGSIAGSISIITYQDIHVAAGATLVVDPSITVLFARYITIDQGGVIQIKCSYGGINCAGIKGAAPSIVAVPIGAVAI